MTTTTESLSEYLIQCPGHCLTVDSCARWLHVSPSTLRRKLAEEGQSFSRLLDHARRIRILNMWQNGRRHAIHFARHCGYQDTPQFYIAFQRIFDKNWSEWKREKARYSEVSV